MNFGQALELLKAGGRARRTGWNGKGMWIPLTPGTSFPPTLARAGAAEHVASQTDMLAEDWEAVSDDPYAEMVQPASKPDHECG